MKKIILASGSPRRKKLLADAGIKFDIDVSDYEEDMTLDLPPHELAKHLSAGKARAVADRHKDAIIVAADTFVVFENKILGKPYTKKKAKKMLKKLSGNTHSVITGFTIIDTATGETISEAHESKLTLRDISSEEIDKYVNSGEPLDKAGAYAIQGGAAHFVEKLEGEFTTIVGFPMKAFLKKLKRIT
jgi:septum formation protein